MRGEGLPRFGVARIAYLLAMIEHPTFAARGAEPEDRVDQSIGLNVDPGGALLDPFREASATALMEGVYVGGSALRGEAEDQIPEGAEGLRISPFDCQPGAAPFGRYLVERGPAAVEPRERE